MRRAPNPFWRYSLRVYRQDGVEQACLALQDDYGADVNLLLFCGWVASEGRCLDGRRLRRAVARVRDWQSRVIVPLRQARRAHKRLAGAAGPASDSARSQHRRLLALELELECVEQSLLAELAASWPQRRRALPPAEAARANLARYLQLLSSPSDAAAVAHAAVLVQAFGSARAAS